MDNQPDSQKEDPKIDLDALEKTEVLSPTELIHKEPFEELLKSIFNVVKKNNSASTKHLSHHPCFFINGSRGSGKTTLLRAVQKHVCENHTKGKRIHLLAEIDPTEFSDDEVFFVSLLSSIQKSIEEQQKPYKAEESRKEVLKELQKSIDLMVKGLAKLILKHGQLENMSDAQFFIQEEVEGGVCCAYLKEQFSNMAENLCKYLDVDALLVTVDDADMNFHKCQEIFETVRKYMLDKRMIFVFAGDLQLYSLVIRGMQINHFGKTSLRYDNERKLQRSLLLDKLEEQYIMKLFPLNNHVKLYSFGEIMQNNDLYITFLDTSETRQEIRLHQFLYRDMPEKVSCYIPGLSTKYISLLNTRSALQLISFWVHHSSPDMTREKAGVLWSKGVGLVVSHALIKHHIDMNSVRNGELHKLLSTIREFVREMKRGIDGAMLLPEIGTYSQQLASFFLFTEVARQVTTYKDLLTYILFLFPRLHKDEIKNISLQSNIICETEDEYDRQIAAYSTAIMLPGWEKNHDADKYFANGVIPLLSHKNDAKIEAMERHSLYDSLRSMGDKLSENPTPDALMYYLAILHSISHIVEGKNSYYCISVYNLLALTIRLLKASRTSAEDRTKRIRFILFSLHDIKSTVCHVDSDISFAKNDHMGDLISVINEKLHFINNQHIETVDATIEKIAQWIEKSQQQSILVTAKHIVSGWRSFINVCTLKTKAAKLFSVDPDDIVKAGSLFADYVSAMKTALTSCCLEHHPQNNDNLLTDCPLWNTLISADCSVATAFNKVNIGKVNTLLDLPSLKKMYNMKLQTQTIRQEYQMRENIDEVLQDTKRELSTWVKKQVSEVSFHYTKNLHEPLKPESKKLQQPYEEQKEKEASALQVQIEKTIKDIAKRNERSLHELWSSKINVLKETIVADFIVELTRRREEFWNYIQPDIRRLENEDRAMGLIDKHVTQFINNQRSLRWEFAELSENKVHMEIHKWKQTTLDYINKKVSSVGKPKK